MNLNRVELIGNLGKDPVLKETQSGKSVCGFSVATNKKWTNKDGEERSVTYWHNIRIWGKPGEWAKRDLKKGDRVFISGELTNRTYENKQKITIYITEIVAEGFEKIYPFEKSETATQDKAPESSINGQKDTKGETDIFGE